MANLQVNMDNLRSAYLEDAREHMTAFERALLDLEKDTANMEAIHTAFRAVHTIKGSGAVFAYDELIRFAHTMENIMDALRSQNLTLTRELTTLLFNGYDHLQALLAYYTEAENSGPANSELTAISNALILRLNQLLAAPATKPAALSYSIATNPDLFRSRMSLENALGYLLKNSDIDSVWVYPDSIPTVEDYDPESCYLKIGLSFAENVDATMATAVIDEAFEFLKSQTTITASKPDEPGAVAALPEGTAKQETKTRSGHSIRVDADKLDDFVNLVGELVMKNSSLQQLVQAHQVRAFLKPVKEMSRLVEHVRELAMNLRMVPIGATFRKMERIVRDTAARIGKDITITFKGDETELDKNIIEKINDPLVHIIRNAADHGIESGDERENHGKPRGGKITLTAFHEAGNIVIEITDDGRGLNYARILEKARERGIADKEREYTPAEIQHFILHPGFSTAETITEISGRGVGMDVVKKNIESLRGTIRIFSEEGKGTTIRIALPLTLAIIDGFLVRSGNQKFIIPLEAIKECIDFRHGVENKSEYDSQLFNLRGEVLPYLRLKQIFHIPGEQMDRESLVIIQWGAARIGIVVDEPMGEYQTVIKPLNGFLSGIPGLGGATILGDGDMALIVDLQGIMELISDGKSKAS
jgi:two-component system, chemotaxis family, sensor kinase CheA